MSLNYPNPDRSLHGFRTTTVNIPVSGRVPRLPVGSWEPLTWKRSRGATAVRIDEWKNLSFGKTSNRCDPCRDYKESYNNPMKTKKVPFLCRSPGPSSTSFEYSQRHCRRFQRRIKQSSRTISQFYGQNEFSSYDIQKYTRYRLPLPPDKATSKSSRHSKTTT